MNNFSGNKAFTLTEVLIAMTILAMTMAIAMTLFMDSFKLTFVSNAKNEINSDIRAITREMSDIARQANYSLIFKSIEESERDSKEDIQGISSTGDALVLFFEGAPLNPQNYSDRPTDRIVIYYRKVTNPEENLGPVMKYDKTITGSERVKYFINLIPSQSEIEAKADEVIALSEGLANQQLFYNIGNKAVMVNGKIVHGNEAKRVTDTYNFTISTRSLE